MRKIIASSFLATASLLIIGSTYAQNPGTVRVGMVETNNTVIYSNPLTTVRVGLMVQKETIRKGPYARFAQKYLGVIAPLADKDIYSVVGATINYFDPAHAISSSAANLSSFDVERSTSAFTELGLSPMISQKVVVSHIESDSGFVKVAPDRSETFERSLEDMASEAANTIFTLRKRRFDLVSGEAGENVFGAGLQAALKELSRMEQEYLSLFLGKNSIQQIEKIFDITPDASKLTYIVCRFSDAGGVLADNDLSGKPIVIEFKPEKMAALYTLPTKGAKVFTSYRVADFVVCRVVDANNELSKSRIPMYQWGVDVEMPTSVGK